MSYAAEENVIKLENEVSINTSVVFTSPTQQNTSGGYTTDHGEGGVISLPNPPGSTDTIIVGGVKDNQPPYTTIPVFTPGSFYLDSDEYSITVGDTLDTVALFKSTPESIQTINSQVFYFSKNPDIAQVDSQGNITGIHPGLTQITAWYQGQQFTASVLVVNPYVAH
ncbi:Bacterial Ig-like domain (group 2) [compost metagenome]